MTAYLALKAKSKRLVIVKRIPCLRLPIMLIILRLMSFCANDITTKRLMILILSPDYSIESFFKLKNNFKR